MLKSKGLPGEFWAEAVTMAVFVLNCSPTKGLAGMTPFEAWYGKGPAVHHLGTFGCVVHVKNAAPHLKKLEDRSSPMIFIGYESGTKGYRVYDPVTKRLRVSRDIVFGEQARWNWEKNSNGEHQSSDTFTVEYLVTREPLVVEGIGEELQRHGSIGDAVSPVQDGDQVQGATDRAPSRSPSVASSDLNADHDEGVPVRTRRLSDILAEEP
jgi:hypothetical protein